MCLDSISTFYEQNQNTKISNILLAIYNDAKQKISSYWFI